MENAITILKETFIRKHGDLKLSKKHKFIGHERGRTDTHVIVGYSYNVFESAKTVKLQYLVPIKEWDNPELFITFKDYVTSPPGNNFKDWFHCISFNLSIKAFEFKSDIGYPCKAEYKASRYPPYDSDDIPSEGDYWTNAFQCISHICQADDFD